MYVCMYIQTLPTSMYLPHQLTVEVTDVNDNAPVCPALLDLQVDRTVEPGHVVVLLEVSP